MSDAVELIGAIAWPVVAVIGLFIFRRHLPAIARGLSARVSKISVPLVSLELVTQTAVSANVLGPLRDLTDPKSTQAFTDSGVGLLRAAREGEKGDYTVIDLGSGRSWLTSRLFIFAYVLSEALEVTHLVFVESTDRQIHRFVGIAEPHVLRRALGKRYPWMERAFVRSSLDWWKMQPAINNCREFYADDDPDVAKERDLLAQFLIAARTTQSPDVDMVEHTSNRFLHDPLIRREPATEADEEANETDWVTLEGSDGERYEEHARWIESGVQLSSLVSHGTLTTERVETTAATTDEDIQAQALRLKADFIAIVEPDRSFLRLLARRQLSDLVAVEVSRQYHGS